MAEQKEKKGGIPAGALVAGVVVGAGALILLATRKGEAAPPEPEPGMFNLYGKVIDAGTGEGVSGVQVTPEGGAPVSTDSNGNYQFLDASSDYYPFSLWVYFRKDGYEDKDVNVTINEGNNELNVQMTPTGAPPTEGISIIAITLDKAELVSGEEFFFSVTFKNDLDYDVYVQPKFALGKLSDSTFSPDKILAGVSWDPETGIYVDPGTSAEWADLGHPNHPGSDMPQFVYDPEGIPVMMPGGGSTECWLKVPAKGQATTTRVWYVTEKDFATGIRDICVEVANPFYLIYQEAWGTRTVGGQTVVLNWKPIALDPLATVASDIANVISPTDVITIDGLEVYIDFAGKKAHANVTITNHSSKTLSWKDAWGDPRSIIFRVYGYYGENFRIPAMGSSPAHTYHPGDSLHMIYQLGADVIYSIAPGTQVIGLTHDYQHSKCYTGSDHTAQTCDTDDVIDEGLKGLAWVEVDLPDARYDVGYKGFYSSQLQAWSPTPVVVTMTGWYGQYTATFPEADEWAADP